LRRGEKPGAQIQRHHVEEAVAQFAPSLGDHRIIITHGNGPQVGLLAVESANDPLLDQPFPFDVLGAQTQGMIGYWIAQAMQNVVPARDVVALITRTEVNPSDPAFDRPTKFIGRVYSEQEAASIEASNGWVIHRDGTGWRRVIASPEPQKILETSTISTLVERGTIVICAGGGGIPIGKDDAGKWRGEEAVIDKDLATSLLARRVHGDVLVFLTDVDYVFVDFGTTGARAIEDTSVEELRLLSFDEGSMGPKVEAACRFVEETGRRAAIGSIRDFGGLLEGTSGTQVTASK
jgi:carbamate kinase